VRRGQSGAGPVLSCLRVALAASGTGREVRKTVTVVFTDLVGSTPLGERLDPESLREVITRYYDRAAEVLARKIVVSRQQRLELTWRNSEQLQGHLAEAVTALKHRPGDGNIAMSGSISVVRQLLARGAAG
jgi:hypothetical protein